MLHVILNPKARSLASRATLTSLKVQVGARARVWVTESLSDLDQAAAAIAAEDPERVALCGGDGTFMQGVSALIRAAGPQGLPPLALVAAGTVATIARRTGSGAPLPIALERFLAPSRPLRGWCQPVLRIAAAGSPALAGFTFGTALVARFFERYSREGPGGIATAARIAAQVFTGSVLGGQLARSVLDPMDCLLTIDGEVQPGSAYSLVVASVLRDVGLGFRVTYRAGGAPGRVHLVASTLPAWRLGPQAPRVLLGLPLTGAGGIDRLVSHFAVRFPGDRPGPLVVDGERIEAPSVAVEPGPVLRLLDLSGR